MKIKAEQLSGNLQKQLLPVYVISGDEPLLAQECADAVRVAARKNGFTERELFHVEGNYDWNHIANEANSLSLFPIKKFSKFVLLMESPATKVAKHSVKFAPIPTQIISY